jgi:hypothetical protein
MVEEVASKVNESVQVTLTVGIEVVMENLDVARIGFKVRVKVKVDGWPSKA